MAYNTDIERLNYFEGEYLGAVDFQAEQEYHRDMRRRHNIGQHTWGIVAGLDIVQIPNGGTSPSGQPQVDVSIQPGMAVDAFGREIVALGKISLTQDLLAPYFDPNPAAPPRPMSIWIAFYQDLLSPSTDPCVVQNQPNAFGRVQETWRVVITPPADAPADDSIVIDGTSMIPPVQPSTLPTPPPPPNPGDIVLPYDGSVPYQEFSTDDTAVNWYVALGRVMWDPHNGVFVQQPDDWAAVGRLYAGNVTAAILSPTGSLSIQDRYAPTPLPTATIDPFYGGVSVDVAGSLTVERLLKAEQDLWIFEPGHLNFKNSGGLDGDTTLWMRRMSNPAGGADLHIHIGDGKISPQRLVIGSGPDNPPSDSGDQTLFDVRSDGNVEIPVGTLTFGNTAAQLINVATTSYGIGVQTNTFFCRSNSDFAWYVGGTYDPGQDKPGGGGTLAMMLDSTGSLTIPAGSLNFGAQTRQMINLWKTNYGIGVQPSTLFFRSDSDFCWYRGGTFANVQDNPGGGVASMTLDSSSALGIAGNLSVNGARTYLLGLDGANNHWIMNGGTSEPGFNALGFNGVAKQVIVGPQWNLNVQGGQNIFAFRQFTQVVTNAGANSPGTWTVNYAGIFSTVYSAFAVFQGFSIWSNTVAFDNHPHGETNVDTIPQHAFVRVDSFDANSASGVAYCSESDASLEGDNCVLFTLVVVGRPII